MLYLVEVRNGHGDLLSLPLDDWSQGYSVKNIDGLDPVKASFTSSKIAQEDGEEFESSERDTRNVILKLGYETDYSSTSVRALRQYLYRFFMPDTAIELRFYDDDETVVYINGHVESMDSPLFTDEPTATISIICFDPDFVDAEVVTISNNTTAITSGDTGNTLVNYTGTIKTGFIFALNLNRSLSEFTLYHQPPDDTLRQLDFIAPLSAGDVLTINTISGTKGATLTRAGSDSSLLYGVSPQSSWLTLLPGVNYIRAYALGSPIPFTLQYTNLYGGL
jgi:hypothetical protein